MLTELVLEARCHPTSLDPQTLLVPLLSTVHGGAHCVFIGSLLSGAQPWARHRQNERQAQALGGYPT